MKCNVDINPHANMPKPRILLCASGSVATVKVPEIALKLAVFAEVCAVYESMQYSLCSTIE